MALQKQINLKNGISLNYHRITSFNKITNINTIIEVSSYINKEQRLIEKNYQEIQQKNANNEQLTQKEQELLENGIDVFIETEFINIPYDEKINIETVYDYLKTTDKYSGSIDV